jgi:hypothetical protein
MMSGLLGTLGTPATQKSINHLRSSSVPGQILAAQGEGHDERLAGNARNTFSTKSINLCDLPLF